MPKTITLATQTMFAELIERCMDAQFDQDFDERGSFIRKRVRGADYWYYQRWQDGKSVQSYVGPVADEAITKRVETFQERIKRDYKQRREMVRALIATGLPRPDAMTGAVVEALWKAGFFRLRGVLIGTNAYQCYAGLLGVRLSGSALRTQDVDFAQYLAISREVEDTMPPMSEVLVGVDKTFTPVMDKGRGEHIVAFRNAVGYRIEFLTPHRGRGDRLEKPVKMPALGNVSAIQLPFLDFLLHDPMRSVMLHGAGVPVLVPSQYRYAIHKLIVAVRRAGEGRAKSSKDLLQASELIQAMTEQETGTGDLIDAWIEAWDRGPNWRRALTQARFALPESIDSALCIEAQLWDAALGGERSPKDFGLGQLHDLA